MITKKDELMASQLQDKIFDVNTGWFHYSKTFISALLKPLIPKIQKGVDSVYDKTKSKNAALFKSILADMEKHDMDIGFSSGSIAGLSRKAFYVLIAKFLICLYEFDGYYAERMDYILNKIKEIDIYIDEQSKPHNWYPHRTEKIFLEYMIRRNVPPLDDPDTLEKYILNNK